MCFVRYSGCYCLPVFIFFWIIVTLAVTYTIAVLLGHTKPLFPLISDTGAFVPESCIFAQMLNLAAILVALFFYVRHRQVREICEEHSLKDSLKVTSKISLYFGVLSCFGTTNVGNFQKTSSYSMHAFGYVLSFGSIIVWQFMQVYVSFKLYPIIGKFYINCLRLILSLIYSICFFTTMITTLLAWREFKGNDTTKWGPKDGGYLLHIVSAITEWILVICTIVYILSFASEFKDVSFNEPRINISNITASVQS